MCIEGPDFSLDIAVPHCAAAIEAQVDCDDASDDFVKEKLHSNVRASGPGSMTGGNARPSARLRAGCRYASALPALSVAGFGVGSIAGMKTAPVRRAKAAFN
jgi:hypothetical protein